MESIRSLVTGKTGDQGCCEPVCGPETCEPHLQAEEKKEEGQEKHVETTSSCECC